MIGEDASTDGTAEIVREYAKKYPDIIVPLIREKNLGIQENSIDIARHCRGKYLACCEGDDYWLCEDKLEKQVDYLEKHSDCFMCITRCKFILNGQEQPYPFSIEDSLSLRDMLNNGKMKRYATCTKLERNIYKTNSELLNHFRCSMVGDIISVTLQVIRGRIHYLDYITGVYERTINEENKSFSSSSLEKQVVEIRKAIRECIIISENKYRTDWYKYEAIFNRGLFIEKRELLGKKTAWKYIGATLTVKQKFYLLRLLLLDYLEYKIKKND